MIDKNKLQRIGKRNITILWDEIGENEVKQVKEDIAYIKKRIQRIGNKQASSKGISVKQMRSFAFLLTQHADLVEQYKELRQMERFIK